MRAGTLLLAAFLTVSFTTIADASWAAYGLETRAIEADLVLIGTVGPVKSTFKRVRDYSIATMQIREVLKGNPELKTVDVAFPAKAILGNDQVRKEGTEGIWLMRLDETGDFYWIDLPSDLQPLADKEKWVALVKKLAGMEWGKETNGVQLLLRGQVVPNTDRQTQSTLKELNGPGIPVLQVFLKNCGDKTIYVCDYAGDKPVKITCIGPGSKAEDVDMYDQTWRKPIDRTNYICLRPGQAKPVGGAGGAYRMRTLSQQGDFQIGAIYTAKRDGKEYKLDDVWTGEATSNTVKMHFNAMPK
jgi:hypothetical protein